MGKFVYVVVVVVVVVTVVVVIDKDLFINFLITKFL
jgi:hypothetical protein